MSVGAVQRIVQLRYAGFYLPILAIIYLWTAGFESIILNVFQTSELFVTIVIITMVGAYINHAINYSIFGPEGPQFNPKNKWTIKYQKYVFYFKSNPKIRPSSIDELNNRLNKYIQDVTKNWFILIKTVIRFLTMVTGSIFYTVFSLLSIIWLFEFLLRYDGGLPAALLLIGLLVFQTRGLIFRRFATPISEEAAPWVFTPEHRKAQTLNNLEEVDLKNDPRGLYAELRRLAERIQRQVKRDRRKQDREETEYLIPIDDEPEYTIKLNSDQDTED